MVLYKQSRGHQVSATGLSLFASLDSSLFSALGLILMMLMFFPQVFKMYSLSKTVWYLIVLQINNEQPPQTAYYLQQNKAVVPTKIQLHQIDNKIKYFINKVIMATVNVIGLKHSPIVGYFIFVCTCTRHNI